MSLTEMAAVVIDNIERINAKLNAPCGLVLHTHDYTRFVCHDARASARLEEPGDGTLYVLKSLRTAKSLQRYWNSKQTDEWCMVTISLRRDALTAHLDRLHMLLDALYELNERKRYDA